MPVCGGAQTNPICADHAVRVTQRTFEYDIATSEIGNRRLLSETTYHQPPAANDVCSNCKFHTTTFSNLPAATWEGNGGHYNVETHSGNLGGDFRQVVTTWSPTVSPWFPNLYTRRTISDNTLTVDRYTEFNAQGFLRGSLLYDSAGQRVFANCRYSDASGNLDKEFSGIFPGFPTPPPNNACSTAYPTMPTFAPGANLTGKAYTYQNSLLLTARWWNASAPAGWKIKDFTRDLHTGWVTSSADSAGKATSYSYDSIGRVTSVTPQDEEAFSVSYPSPTQTIATRSVGLTLATSNEYDYDALGRLIREVRLMPNASNVKCFSLFDGRGYEYFKSEWVLSGTSETIARDIVTADSACPFANPRPSAAPGTFRSCFDVFGRPQSVVGPHHTSHQTITRTDGAVPFSDTLETVTTGCVNGTFSSAGVCQNGTDSVTSFRKDAFGRLTGVTEPGGDQTAYTYDVNDKLTSVTQGTQPPRAFAFDPAGNPRTETTPEKGTVSFDYGNGGNNMMRTEHYTDGVTVTATITAAYDYAKRVLSVATSEPRTYVTNTYDQATIAGVSTGFSLGKLTTSAASNYALSTGLAAANLVTDTYVYSGVGGRLSSRTTAVTGSQTLTATQSWTYNTLGLLSGYTHPRASGNAAFSTTSDFDAGLPKNLKVNGNAIASSITYWPSGSVGSYTTNNGAGHSVTTTLAQDGSSLSRPASITTSGATSNFSSGAYSYDGAGNIRSIGSDTFTYDPRSRLSGATILDGSATHTESFSYDRYGSMLSRTMDGPTIPFSMDTSRNRLTTGANTSYDTRGNLTKYGVGLFSYDGLSRQTKFAVQSSPTDERYLYDAGAERIARVTPAAAISGPPSLSFHTVAPCRLADTRTGSGFTSFWGPPSLQGSGFERTFPIAGQCGIPAGAKAVSFNISVINPAALGDLRVFPAGTVTPLVSTLHWPAGIFAIANAAVVALGPTFIGGDGIRVHVDSSGTLDLVVDVNGYFTTPGGSGDLNFHAVTPCRLADTRTGSGFTSFWGPPSLQGFQAERTFPIVGQCGIPAGAKAVSFNISAITPAALGDLRVFPAGTATPLVATLDWPAGIFAIANAAVVALGPTGIGGDGIKVHVDSPGTLDLVVDVNGYFAAPGGPDELTFHAAAPCRIINTQVGSGYTSFWGPPSLQGFQAERTFPIVGQCGVPPGARAVLFNLTAITPAALGGLRVFPASTVTPLVSALNWPTGVFAIANAAVVAVGPTGIGGDGITVHVDSPGTLELVVDISGYFAPAAVSADAYYFTFRDERSRLATEYRVDGGGRALTKDYVYLGNLLLATQEGVSRQFYSSNHLGTARLVTDTNATTLSSYKYRTFGLQLSAGAPGQAPDFAGMEKDLLSGNHYDHARFYAGWLGRFQVPDLIGGNPGDPQSWNRYTYAKNNPLKYVDPDGRAVMPSTEASQAAVDYQNQKRAFDGLVNAQTMRANWSNGNYWFEVATAATNTFLSDPTLAMLPSPMALEVPGEASLLKLTSGNFRQNLMRAVGKSAGEVAGRDAHHMLSQAEKLAEQFSKAGLNIHEPKFGAFWEHATHLRQSSQFNADWTAFLSKDRTAEQIQKYARVLAVKYDIPW